MGRGSQEGDDGSSTHWVCAQLLRLWAGIEKLAVSEEEPPLGGVS